MRRRGSARSPLACKLARVGRPVLDEVLQLLGDPRPTRFQLPLDDAAEEHHRSSEGQRRVDVHPRTVVVDTGDAPPVDGVADKARHTFDRLVLERHRLSIEARQSFFDDAGLHRSEGRDVARARNADAELGTPNRAGRSDGGSPIADVHEPLAERLPDALGGCLDDDLVSELHAPGSTSVLRRPRFPGREAPSAGRWSDRAGSRCGAVDLVAEAVDIGVVVGQLPETTFVGRLLGRATWVLAAAPSYLDAHGRPRTPTELSAHRCLRLLSNPPQDEWTLVDRRGREVTVQVRGGYEADDSRALGDAAYAGLGIGVRPAGECTRAQRGGRLERVLPGYRFQPLDVYALVPKGRLRVPRVAACIEALRAAVHELA